MGIFNGFRNFDPAASYVSAYQTGLQNYEILRAIGAQRQQQAQQAELVRGMAEQLAAQNPGYADYYNLLAANPRAPLSAQYLQQIFAAEKGGQSRSTGSKSSTPPIRPNWSAGVDPITGREYVGNPRIGTARPTGGRTPNSAEEARVAAQRVQAQQEAIPQFIKAPGQPAPAQTSALAPVTAPQVIPGGIGETRTDANGVTRTVVRQPEPLSISESLRLGVNDLKGLFLPTPRTDLAPVQAAPPVQVVSPVQTVAPAYSNPFATVLQGYGNYFSRLFLPTPQADLTPAPFIPPVDTGLAP